MSLLPWALGMGLNVSRDSVRWARVPRKVLPILSQASIILLAPINPRKKETGEGGAGMEKEEEGKGKSLQKYVRETRGRNGIYR